jgi:hypothetical protein
MGAREVEISLRTQRFGPLYPDRIRFSLKPNNQD